MIEVLVTSRCTGCNICVRVCPTNVFDPQGDGPPRIARQEDCQTCFFCEVYCPEDALFVAPLATSVDVDSPLRDEEHLIATGKIGSYRKDVGWGRGRTPGAQRCQSFRLTAKYEAMGLLVEPPPRIELPKNFPPRREEYPASQRKNPQTGEEIAETNEP